MNELKATRISTVCEPHTHSKSVEVASMLESPEKKNEFENVQFLSREKKLL
jgi:hypothetical protein